MRYKSTFALVQQRLVCFRCTYRTQTSIQLLASVWTHCTWLYLARQGTPHQGPSDKGVRILRRAMSFWLCLCRWAPNACQTHRLEGSNQLCKWSKFWWGCQIFDGQIFGGAAKFLTVKSGQKFGGQKFGGQKFGVVH